MNVSDEQPVAAVEPKGGQSILGIPMEDLAGLTVEQICNNQAAVTMVMHYYKQLADENSSLKNDLNTTRTYVAGFENKTVDTQVGAALAILGSILAGFGINIITGSLDHGVGWGLLTVGLVVHGFALFFSLRKRR